MIRNNQPQFKRLSDRGIVTLSIITTILSLGLIEYIHKIEYASRLAANPAYEGQYGGEMAIPLMIVFVTMYILSRREKKRYEKYYKKY